MKHANSFADYTTDELKGILCWPKRSSSIRMITAISWTARNCTRSLKKTSNRTYLSFSIGMEELGGKAYNQLWKDSNFTIGDLMSEVKYVCRNVDCIMGRFKKAETTEGFMKNATVPVINGCDNTFHPTQALADMLTLYEKTGHFEAKVLSLAPRTIRITRSAKSSPKWAA